MHRTATSARRQDLSDTARQRGFAILPLLLELLCFAAKGKDYNDKSGTITFGVGETTKTVTVSVKNDSILEAVEHLKLKVDLPNGIAESSGGIATIYDGDSINTAKPFVSVFGTDAVEGDSSYAGISFTVALSSVTSETVSVQWRLGNGTATIGGADTDTDYYTGGYASGTAYIYAGQLQSTVTVYPKGDLVAELDENFVVEIFTPTNAQLAGNVNAVRAPLWVRDNDGTAQPLALHVSSPEVRETDSGVPTASFVLELSRVATSDMVIKYETRSGTAKAGEDFVKKVGSVSILKGERRAVVGVEITPDNSYEGSENFTLKVTPPSAVKQVSGGAATILNDDLVTDVPILRGTSRNNTINGTSNVEDIRGGGGNDTIRAKSGDDKVSGDAGNDKLFGDSGADTIRGGAGKDSIYGGAGGDKAYGDDGDDTIRGEDGIDILKGGDGKDTIYGGDSADQIYGDDDADKLFGDAGNDRIWGGDGNDEASGGAGNDEIRGGKGNDKLKGDAGNDKLWGEANNDNLSGGAGNDRVDGGDGNDRSSGGAGDDVFYFDNRDGSDVVSDFNTDRDQIAITSGARDVDDLDFDRVSSGLEVSWGSTKVVLANVAMADADDIDFIF